jgi:hypothetical protein
MVFIVGSVSVPYQIAYRIKILYSTQGTKIHWQDSNPCISAA